MREVERGLSGNRKTYFKYVGEDLTMDGWFVFVHIPKDLKSGELFVSVCHNDNNDRCQVYSVIELYTKVHRILEECEGKFRSQKKLK